MKINSLIVDNIRGIEIFDNNGSTIDRYIVVFKLFGKDMWKMYSCLIMSSDPFHPQGVCQYSSCKTGKHLGKRIEFKNLPEDCKQAVINSL